jgi:hypothetical protein
VLRLYLDRFDPSHFLPDAAKPRFAFLPFGSWWFWRAGVDVSNRVAIAPAGAAGRARHAAAGCPSTVLADTTRRLTDLPQRRESSRLLRSGVHFFVAKCRRVA